MERPPFDIRSLGSAVGRVLEDLPRGAVGLNEAVEHAAVKAEDGPLSDSLAYDRPTVPEGIVPRCHPRPRRWGQWPVKIHNYIRNHIALVDEEAISEMCKGS
jgi:hypothetical protein